ncbi:MAG: SAM-dependent chlorinase/fluorinase [Bacteroidales bacterium]|nr:SAM-dependent chlorinase/fluorinase [Bacteroidales bacterium]
MAIITLISDWGDSDYYTAVVKGSIYKQMPDVQIVDITHNIKAFQISQAAYVLRNTFPDFPDGTVHIIGVNSEESMDQPHTVAFYKEQYFIGTDNGIFSLLFDGEPDKVIELDIPQEAESFTFSSRDRFAKAAVHLAAGGKLGELGTKRDMVNRCIDFKPIREKNRIRGVIMHVDPYHNLVTNISKAMFNGMVKKQSFRISLRGDSVSRICASYGDVSPGNLVALFSSNGMLEIALNEGAAALLLGLKEGDAIIVEVGEADVHL